MDWDPRRKTTSFVSTANARGRMRRRRKSDSSGVSKLRGAKIDKVAQRLQAEDVENTAVDSSDFGNVDSHVCC